MAWTLQCTESLGNYGTLLVFCGIIFIIIISIVTIIDCITAVYNFITLAFNMTKDRQKETNITISNYKRPRNASLNLPSQARMFCMHNRSKVLTLFNTWQTNKWENHTYNESCLVGFSQYWKKKWLLLTWARLKPNATSLNYLPIVNVIPAFIFPGLAQSVHDKNT